MSSKKHTFRSSLFEDTINSVKQSHEYVQSIGQGNSSHNFENQQERYRRVQFSRDINDRDFQRKLQGASNSKERVDKMREIKGEINELLSKIDSASKQITDNVTSQRSNRNYWYGVEEQENRISTAKKTDFSLMGSTSKVHEESTPIVNNPLLIQDQNSTRHQMIREFEQHNKNQHQLQQTAKFSELKDSIPKEGYLNTLTDSQERSWDNRSNQDFIHKGEYLMMRRSYDQVTESLKSIQAELDEKQRLLQLKQHECQEVKLKYELEIDQLTLTNKQQQQRIWAFERQTEIKDILEIYNEQMSQLEAQNKNLIIELRKLAKVQANEILILKKHKDPSQYQSKLELFEKNIKSLKLSIKKLTSELQKSQSSLSEYHKKERIFNLQKRCIEDSYKKANIYYQKMNQYEQNFKDLKEKNSQLSEHQKENEGLNMNYLGRIQELESELQIVLEENKLLRDFAYNIDPQAKEEHQKRFQKDTTINDRDEEKMSSEEKRWAMKWNVNSASERKNWPSQTLDHHQIGHQQQKRSSLKNVSFSIENVASKTNSINSMARTTMLS